MNIKLLAADIASRVPEMARDSAINNAELIENLINEELFITGHWRIFWSRMNIKLLAADIASRVPEMARDSAINNAELIEFLINEELFITGHWRLPTVISGKVSEVIPSPTQTPEEPAGPSSPVWNTGF